VKFHSRVWLSLEMLFLAGPITVLFVASSWLFIVSPLGPYFPYGLALQLITVASAFAIVSGWYLAYIFVRRGSIELLNTTVGPWVIAFAGLLPALLSTASAHLPKSEPYSPMDNFRFNLDGFRLGWLLLLPLLHLLVERHRMRTLTIVGRDRESR
jgi:hypothetical protein